MKYRETKSNITEYKQKEIQGKKSIACTLTSYKEEHDGSSLRWAKEAQEWTEGSETSAEKIGRNCKKTQKIQK
jgi:hypothetical protein